MHGGRRVWVNRDFIELLAAFNAHAVEYLVVGAHALAARGVLFFRSGSLRSG
jgi:hypothetical protein